MTLRFTAGDKVLVFDRNGSQEWRAARIERPEPYRGREGYYILWTFDGRREQWESAGGWVQGRDVLNALDSRLNVCGVRECGVAIMPGLRVCRRHAAGMAAASAQAAH